MPRPVFFFSSILLFSMVSHAKATLPQVDDGWWVYKSTFSYQGKEVNPAANLQSLSKSMPSGMGNNPAIMKQMEAAIKKAQNSAKNGHEQCYSKASNKNIFESKIPGCEPPRIIPAGDNKFNVSIFCEGQMKCTGTLTVVNSKKITGESDCTGVKETAPGMFKFDRVTMEGQWKSAVCPKPKK